MAITNFLRLTSTKDNNVISLNKTGSPEAINIEYRTDLNQEWLSYTIGTLLTLFKNSWIEFRNDTGKFSTDTNNYYKFVVSTYTHASGNINSLLDYTQDNPPLKDYCFLRLFNGCGYLQKPPELPATTLTLYCYFSIFNGCWSLIQAPVLPATTMANYCYSLMFNGCGYLTNPPDLPATTLAGYCYMQMFQKCTRLSSMPVLGATTLAVNCYMQMFQDCPALTKADKLYLPLTFTTNALNQMFGGCANLTEIIWRSKTLPSSTTSKNWLSTASSTGTFYYTHPKFDAASVVRDGNGVPEGWSISLMKPEAGGVAVKINGVDVKTFNLLGKPVAKLSVNGVPVKGGTPAYGPDVEIPSFLSKLQYVSSNGGTLDTGIPTNGNLKVGIKWSKPVAGTGMWPEIFGNKSLAGTAGDYYKAFAFRLNSNGAGTSFGAHYGFYHGLYSPTEQTYGGMVDIIESDPSVSDTVNEFWLSPTEFSWNGQVFNILDYANQYGMRDHNDWEYLPSRLDGSNMFLFTSKTSSRQGKVNCYNFYIIDTTTNDVLLNYIPCRIGTLVGFFDTVSLTFAYHTSFIAGPAA